MGQHSSLKKRLMIILYFLRRLKYEIIENSGRILICLPFQTLSGKVSLCLQKRGQLSGASLNGLWLMKKLKEDISMSTPPISQKQSCIEHLDIIRITKIPCTL